MKTFVPLKKLIKKFSAFAAGLLVSSFTYSQIIPELVFTNAVLESGSHGQDGAKYRFTNVGPALDALVEITGRSSTNVILTSIDTSGAGLGYTKAFQPVLGIPGSVPINTTWSMDFKLIFLRSGTNTPVVITQFYVTGLDIDGDGSALSEWSIMKKIKSIDSASVNSLTFTKIASWVTSDDYKIEGIIANSPGIDTSALNVMAKYKYMGTSEISFTIGAKTNALSTSSGMRLNSLWFKEFANPALPVRMESFTANLIKNTAELNWKTVTEIDASHFVVEKSRDGKNFTACAIVFANGNTTWESNYTYSDKLTVQDSSINYYRIRSVDLDGKSVYSAIRIVRTTELKISTIQIIAYPNPVVNELRITIPANWQNKKITYEVINASGNIFSSMQTAAASQTETVNMNKATRGFYFVRVHCNGEIAQQKIVKN